MNSKFSRKKTAWFGWVREKYYSASKFSTRTYVNVVLLSLWLVIGVTPRRCTVSNSAPWKLFSHHCMFCKLVQSMKCTPRWHCHSYIFAVTFHIIQNPTALYIWPTDMTEKYLYDKYSTRLESRPGLNQNMSQSLSGIKGKKLNIFEF